MSPEVPPARTAIGATLRDARRRYGLEVREVEERTKIRAKYIRALENEDWETLPAPAYVRGFLRTYGQMLGLDGEMLADEYRRHYGDGPTTTAGGGPEPLLSERRRSGDRQPPSRGLIVGGVIAAILVLILILGLLPGGDDEEPATDRSGMTQRENKGGDGNGKGGGGDGGSKPKLEPVDAVLVARSDVTVCLVGDDKDALIDGQQLQADDREEYEGYKNYRLDLGPGQVDFTVGGKKETVGGDGNLSVEGDSDGIRQIEYRGGDCP
jgi:cytoskeleton protein RodZ